MDGIETTTWHDQKPSHNPKPDNLMELEYQMEKAWLDYDHLIEKRYDWYAGITTDEVTPEQIDEQREVAVRYQNDYWQAWYKANSDMCTCNPNSATACDVCKAQINSKANERIQENE